MNSKIKKNCFISLLMLLILHLPINIYAQNSINKWEKLPSYGMYSAYARALAVDPQNPNIIYVGLKGGGVYKSENKASLWEEKNNGLSNGDILSLAVNSNHTNIIYAGTEQGIFKSIDSAYSWQRLNFPACHVNSIAIHPVKDSIIYAATGKLYGKGETSNGLWLSMDDGTTWRQILLEHHGIPVEVYTIHVYNDTLFRKEVRVILGTSNGIWSDNTDKGKFEFESHNNNLWTQRVYCFVTNPNNPECIYAGTWHGLHLSKDYGFSWMHLDTTLYGKSITSLAADDTYLYVGTNKDGIFKTMLFTEIYISPDNIRKIDWERIADGKIKTVYSILSDPTNSLITYFASPKGVFKSEKPIKTDPENFSSHITGITCAQMNGFLINPQNHNIFYAATQSGGFESNNDGEISWRKIKNLPDEEIKAFAYNPKNPDDIYGIVCSNGIYQRIITMDTTWVKITPGELNIFSMLLFYQDNSKSILYGSDIAIYKNNRVVCDKTRYPVSIIIQDTLSNIFYAGTKGNGIFKSTDWGDSWEKIEDDNIAFAIVNTLAINPAEATLVCGTDQGIFKTDSTDISWIPIEDPAIKYFKVNDLCFHPENSKILLAGTEQGGVFISRDQGETWKDFNDGLTIHNILCLNALSDESIKFYTGTEGNSIYYLNLCDPEIAVSPSDTLLFSNTRIENSTASWITIKNAGDADLKIKDIISMNKAFQVDFDTTTVKPDDSINVEVIFKPDCAVQYIDSLKILSNDPFTPVYTIYLKGKGVASIILLATEHNFEKVRVDSSKNWTLKIINAGNYTLSIDSIKVKKYPDIYRINPTSGKIDPDVADTFAINVTFKPQDTTKYPDTLIIYSNAYSGESSVILSGEGVMPVLAYQGTDAIDFNRVRLKQVSDTTLTIKNIGSDVLNIFKIFLKNSNDKVFRVCPQNGTILPDSSLFVTVAFAPLKRVDYIDTLVIQNDSYKKSDRLKKIELHGYGIAPQLFISEKDLSHDFGEVKVGDSTIWNFTIKNEGNEVLTIEKFCLCDSNVFKTNYISNTIQTNSSVVIEIKFKPQFGIQYEGCLIIESDDPDNPLIKIALEGQGIENGVDTIPPIIVHDQLTLDTFKHKAIPIRAIITDDSSGVAFAHLYFRMGGEPQFRAIKLTNSKEDLYEGLIPSSHVTTRGLEYYFIAHDKAGNKVPAPKRYYTIQVYVEEPGECPLDSSGYVATATPYGQLKTDYHLFSIPLILKDPFNRNVLGELGTYGIDWRLFGYENETYFECGNIFFVPGKSFWLIVKDALKLIYTGPAISVSLADTSRFRNIAVSNQWRAIANPFNFRIPIDHLFFKNDPNSILNICTYNNGWIISNTIKYLDPWEGYLIKHHADDTLYIDPDLSPDHAVPWKPPITAPEWQIQIKAECEKSKDTCNYVGVYQDASDSWDYHDLYKPPRMGDYVMVYFPHENWHVNPDTFTTDFQPDSVHGNIWDFEVETNLKQKAVNLFFDITGSFPPDFDAYLLDPERKMKVDLKQTQKYSYYSDCLKSVRKFILIAGNESFIYNNDPGFVITVSEFALLKNYPNPFNQITTINYILDCPAKVDLFVFNLLGERVRKLISGSLQEAGEYQIRWDGLDENERSATSGIYFYQLRAGNRVKIEKMILIR